jgi:hypothetical protein
MKQAKRGAKAYPLTFSTCGGMALPPMPIRRQSMRSPSSLKVSRPTTIPFSEATTWREERVQPSMHEMSSRTASDSRWSCGVEQVFRYYAKG